MKITVVGLGKMGSQIARKLEENGFKVFPHERDNNRIETLKKFGKDQIIIWLMIPSEKVDEELNSWLKIIPKGSILIDGGNSDFRLTQRRSKLVSKRGSTLVDVGTSGGVWGYDNGFSMMVGGEEIAFKIIEPILKTLAKPSGAYQYFGESGSGHYVKMVHNAIEYGMMESIAEGYRLLKEGPYKNLDLVSAGEVWQHRSVITSWLNELTVNALKANKDLKDVDGKVAESGEARFALETAKKFNIETPAIQAALDVRIASQKGKVNFATKLLALMRNAFGGHKINQ